MRSRRSQVVDAFDRAPAHGAEADFVAREHDAVGLRPLLPIRAQAHRGLVRRLLIAFACISLGGCDLFKPSCFSSLDAHVLQDLVISPPTAQMQPGGTLQFGVGRWQCCNFIEPVGACVDWSVRPQTGARMGADGLLAVDPTTPPGSVFTVTANIEDGRRILTIEVHVFTRAQNPLVGFWREVAQLECRTGTEVRAERPIGELEFRADSMFSVTWTPFETYRDYWGRYTFDAAAGLLSIRIESGNYRPPDVVGNGTFAFDESSRLLLRDLWLGTPSRGGGPARCGHVFRRSGS